MVPLQRFVAILDACVMYSMLVRDVVLTLAAHDFFNPKWSPRIRGEWMQNLSARLQVNPGHAKPQAQVEKISAAIAAAFPDAEVATELSEVPILDPVDPKDRHVVMTAIAAHADAIITFNIADFAVDHLHEELQIEVIHPDDFIMDLITLNEKRAVAAFESPCPEEESSLGHPGIDPSA